MKGMENIAVLPSKVEIHGTFSEQFSAVKDAFSYNLNSGQDIGAAVAILVDGEPVVDLWGGYFDGTYTREFEHDTIVQLYSSTKTMTALCALYLADQGEIDLDAPVAKYWPEFATEGKGEIAIRQVLGHTSGVCGWAVPMSFFDLFDLQKSVDLLARQAPLFTPGRTSGYHGFTQGPIISEIIRRVTGKTLGQFLNNDIAGPLGVADIYHIGTPKEYDHKVSPLIQGAVQDRPSGGNRLQVLSLYNPHPSPQDTWTIEWWRAELGGMGGHGNALAIATLQSVIASGGANGVQMMSDAGRERILEQQSDGLDLVVGVPCRWGMGYSLETSHIPGVPAGNRAGWWAGNGGSIAFVDLDARMSIGYSPNRWISGPYEQNRSRSIIAAAYQSLAQNA